MLVVMAEYVSMNRGGQYEVNNVLCCKIVLGKKFDSFAHRQQTMMVCCGI